MDLKSPKPKKMDDAIENEVKKRLKTALKSSLTSVSERFLCPLSQELMVDPVVAEDGKI